MIYIFIPFERELYLDRYGPMKQVERKENPSCIGRRSIINKKMTLNVLPIISIIQWTTLNILSALKRLYMFKIMIMVYI